MNYTLAEVAAVCGGKLVVDDGPSTACGFSRSVGSVITDSRGNALGKDPLFIAITGANHDGHDYIRKMYVRGVRAFLVERLPGHGEYHDAAFVVVENTVDALQGLAADYRSKFGGTVVGITGSNGKTVVKEWIAQLVPTGVKLFRSPKSYNSQIGVPLSILMMQGDEDLAIIEAGISQPGEMARLQRIIKPDIGLFTTIGDAHQENFDSEKQKISEKLLLFADAKVVIYNSAYAQVEALIKECLPQARAVDSACNETACGIYSDTASRQNAAMSVTFCDVMGYDHDATLSRLALLQPVAMRLELKEGLSNSLIVNDTYNSDINSLAIALDYLGAVSGGRPLMVILSDILQSGYPEGELYGKVAEMIRGAGIVKFIGIGEKIARHAQLFAAGSEFYPSAESFLRIIRREDYAGRAILIKGNRASRFDRLSHALESKSHTTVLEVDLDAMIHNLNAHRALLSPGVGVMAMVKASAYGHGSYETASMLQQQGVDYLAVAFADEGVELRREGITMPIVVLNADAGSFEAMVANDLEPELYSINSLQDFTRVARRFGVQNYPVHIKLDTGMHRLGFSERETSELIEIIGNFSGLLTVASIFSHLASSDNAADDEFTLSQIARFEDMSSRITSTLPYKPLLHVANSAAIERFPHAQYDMVRLGIGLYGVGSTPEMKLKEAATLQSRIVQIKDLSAGEGVGYGCEGLIERPSRIATIPVGYADGLDRKLGNGNWSVLVGGKPAPLVGRVCMDTCMADVTGIDAEEGDRVTIFGTEPANRAEDMAESLGTIAYEVFTSLSSRIKRIYIKQ